MSLLNGFPFTCVGHYTPSHEQSDLSLLSHTEYSFQNEHSWLASWQEVALLFPAPLVQLL